MSDVQSPPTTTDKLAAIGQGDAVLSAALADLIDGSFRNMQQRHAAGDHRTMDQVSDPSLDGDTAVIAVRNRLQILRNAVRVTPRITSENARASLIVMIDEIAALLGLELGWADRGKWKKRFDAIGAGGAS